MKIAYWRLFLSVPVVADHPYVVISNAEAKRMRKHFDADGRRSMLAISAATEADETPRAFYVNIDHVTAIEPVVAASAEATSDVSA